jgi:hypothetical protein
MKSQFVSLFFAWTLMQTVASRALHRVSTTNRRRGGYSRPPTSQAAQLKNIKREVCLAFIGPPSEYQRTEEKKTLPPLYPGETRTAAASYVNKVRGGDYPLPGPIGKRMQPLRVVPTSKGEGKAKLSAYEFNSSQIAVFASIVRTLTFVGFGNIFYGVMRLCLATIAVFQRRHENSFIFQSFRLSDLDAIIPNIIEIYVALIILKSADALREMLSSQTPDNVETLVYSMSLFDKALKKKRPPIFLKGVAAAGALAAAIKAILFA